MIHLLYSSFRQKFSTEKFNSYLNLLPAGMVQQISRYRRWEDAHASLIGKLLLVEGLKKYGGDHHLLHNMKYSEYNRPYLDHVEFNISHSGSYVVCAISVNTKIGIDVEEVKQIEFNDFNSQFTETEWQVINADNDPLRGFYKMWTKKEAIVKADGKGLSIPLKDIIIREEVAQIKEDKWYLKNIPIDSNYIVHLASNRQLSEEMQIKNVEV